MTRRACDFEEMSEKATYTFEERKYHAQLKSHAVRRAFYYVHKFRTVSLLSEVHERSHVSLLQVFPGSSSLYVSLYGGAYQ